MAFSICIFICLMINDSRAHMSKAQAENMELRTQLEKERNRNETLEAKMRELEKDLKYIKGTNSELESELEQTRNLLKGSNKKDIPTMQSLSEERDGLVEVLGTTQSENERLREVSCVHHKSLHFNITVCQPIR